MKFDLVFTGAVLLYTFGALMREWAPPAFLVTAAMAALLLAGIITPTEALSGFSNPALVTIASLLVVSRAVERVGGLRRLTDLAFRSRETEQRALARLLLPAVGLSAGMNNTPIIAMLIGPVSSAAERSGKSASRFLLPLNHAVLLGGTVTLIGTSTNLVVSGLMIEAGMRPLGMFELTPIALPIVIVSVLLLIFISPHAIPGRRGPKESFSGDAREYCIEMKVQPDGPVVGRTIAEAGLRHLQGVFLAWIYRGDELITPISPDERLEPSDRLGFVGSVNRVMDLQAIRGLQLAASKHVKGLANDPHRFVEVVIASLSPLIGKTLVEVGFREQYQATVLAIHRSGERVVGKLGDAVLQPGDTLLLLSDHEFVARWRDRRDFLLVADRDGVMPVRSHHAWLVLVLAAVMVIASAFEVVPILEGALVAAVVLVATKVVSPAEARAAIDLDLLLTLAASFSLGKAIEVSGLGASIAGLIVQSTSGEGPVIVLGMIVASTLLVTQFITNNAAAVLLLPVALAAARQVGADSRHFAIAVAIAASGSFMTPIGYQTNTMIYGPGGYRFGDYVKLGLPLCVVFGLGIIAMTAIHAAP